MDGARADGAAGRRRRAATAALTLACGLASLFLTAAPAGAAIQTFTNPAAIAIPDAAPAVPYPSSISVSGLTTPVTKITASLHGFGHDFPSDVDVLLVAPTGGTVILMADVPDQDPFCNNDVAGLQLVFDDAAGPIPGNQTLASGTYRPTNSAGTFDPCGTLPDNFPPPAPPGPYGATLSVFNGTDPNGTWDLYVVDDAGGAAGQIAMGWSLSFTVPDPVPVVPAAPVAPAQAVSEDPKCRHLRRKLKRQKNRLGKAETEKKRSMIRRNIEDTRDRLRRLNC